MQTLVQVTYEERYERYGNPGRLAPNNLPGRVGATLYKKTDQGFGLLMPLMGTVGMGIPAVGGLASAGIVAGVAIVMSIVLFHFLLIGCMAYARYTAKPFENAASISKAREKYRAMEKEDRKVAKSLISNMERNVKQNKPQLALERAQKFNELAEVLIKTQEVVEDKSDIEAADNFLSGLRELETAHRRALTR